MAEKLQFALKVMDTAWFLEVAIWALSWMILCHGWPWRAHPGKRAAEVILLAAAIGVGQTLSLLLTGNVIGPNLLLQVILQGVLGSLLLYFRSEYHRKARLVMWCSMLAGIVAINSIGGQCTFLAGQFLPGAGFAGGIARCAVALLSIPLAQYLHSFRFEEYEQVPASGLSAILIGDASIITMNILEVFWADQDYRITVVFLVSYIFLLLMILAAMRGMHDMRAEQNEIVELQAERQRLYSERELARVTEENLEDLRGIRHDLKNQYSYMQILLAQRRYEELEEYFRQSSENLLQMGQFIDCGNRAINTILNMEFAKAGKAEVSVSHQLVVPPVLPFGEDDLRAVLTNLLDNAIEECVRLKRMGRGDPALRLEIYPQKSYLFVLCRNTTDRTELVHTARGLRTTKGDERLHGYGTRIVTKIAEKYNGCAEFALSDGMFVAKLLLDMTVEERK